MTRKLYVVISLVMFISVAAGIVLLPQPIDHHLWPLTVLIIYAVFMLALLLFIREKVRASKNKGASRRLDE